MVDSVLVLIAEEKRVRLESVRLSDLADNILFGLPDDIQRGPKIMYPPSPAATYRLGDEPILEVPAGTEWWPAYHPDEAHLISDLNKGRGMPEPRRSELIREWRADKARIDAVLDASGYTAAKNAAAPVEERADELWCEIEETTPTTIAGAIAMIELAEYDPSSGMVERAVDYLRELEELAAEVAQRLAAGADVDSSEIGAKLDRQSDIEDEISGAVARDKAGLIAQLHLLARHHQDFQWGTWGDDLVSRVIAGIAILGGRP